MTATLMRFVIFASGDSGKKVVQRRLFTVLWRGGLLTFGEPHAWVQGGIFRYQVPPWAVEQFRAIVDPHPDVPGHWYFYRNAKNLPEWARVLQTELSLSLGQATTEL